MTISKKGLERTKGRNLRRRNQTLSKGLEEVAEDVVQTLWMAPMPMSGVFTGDKEFDKAFREVMRVTRDALVGGKLQSSIIDKMLAEVIAGAYQDRVTAYGIVPTEMSVIDPKTIGAVQRIRQKADMHLIRMIQAFRDMRRPPINVVVKQTQQVNAADKQVNVAQNKEPAK